MGSAREPCGTTDSTVRTTRVDAILGVYHHFLAQLMSRKTRDFGGMRHYLATHGLDAHLR
jgi:hypothetical protein